ncbi:hypothetical protein TWF506_004341 [Arthrobotrys conoides]|uniref:Uncharacterized protein n=1 Tax=Arthrobotrys conoides TaxID=74498 RepID=A0AAN8RIA8_9PEZI
MDYDSYIKHLTADSIPLEDAERIIAEHLCEHVNELAKNAHNIYEDALEQRCKKQGQRYLANHEEGEKFPLELFTSNIKENKLDSNKWSETLQQYLLKKMAAKSNHDGIARSQLQQILHHIKSADEAIDSSFPLENEPLEDGRAGDRRLWVLPAIALGVFIGSAIALVAIGATTGIILYNQRRRQQTPQRGILRPINHGGGSGGGKTENPPNSQTESERKKRDDRNKKRRKKRTKEGKRRGRKDYYFGYIDRIDRIKNGFEIRIEAIAENSLIDETFLREVQKVLVASGIAPEFGRHRLALIYIFIHEETAGLQEGTWINFKLDTRTKSPVTMGNPNLSGTFDNGITILKILEPTFNFLTLSSDCYLNDNAGYVVQTEMRSITKDIPANIAATLVQAFESFDCVKQSIHGVIGQIMGNAKDDTFTLEPELGEDVASTSASMVPTAERATKEKITKILFSKSRIANKYSLFNVGQGHSARVANGKTEMFANDFGIGLGKTHGSNRDVCSHMIRKQGHLPILLSHWDVDHYIIAKSAVAKEYAGTADDVKRRDWVAPGAKHIKGTVANQFAWSLQRNGTLHQWPENTQNLTVENVQIIRCQPNPQYRPPDKNNDGALALVIGHGDELLLYPGDANFESIPGIKRMGGHIRTVIATHHGSTKSLLPKKDFVLSPGTKKGDNKLVGASIPIASSGISNAVFSYRAGNSYGHNFETAFPFYEAKGYTICEATELFEVYEDTLCIDHFDNFPKGGTKLNAFPDVGRLDISSQSTLRRSRHLHLKRVYSTSKSPRSRSSLFTGWRKSANSLFQR